MSKNIITPGALITDQVTKLSIYEESIGVWNVKESKPD